MITDAAALGLALFADVDRAAALSSRARRGFGSAEVLAAFVNVMAMPPSWRASRSRRSGACCAGGRWLGGRHALVGRRQPAGVGARAGGGPLNTRGALLHVMGDLLGSLAAIVAGGVIVATGRTPIDPLLSLAVALLILRSMAVLRQSTGVLMEGVPTHLDYDAIGRSLAALPGVTDVHDLHIWHVVQASRCRRTCRARRRLARHARACGGSSPPPE
jgi:cobalt-zinc-cadmium efflux system protein